MVRAVAAWFALVFLPAIGFSAPVKPFLCPLFAAHMVLQRDVADPIWGWAEPGTDVTVSVGDKTAQAVAGADGRWEAKLDPMPAGGPVTLKVVAANYPDQTLDDILIGDVWLCSGESNMTMAVRAAANGRQEVADADHPKLRLFTVPAKASVDTVEVPGGTWSVCTPETAADFSAAAYFFGRDLSEKLGVPIGLIHASVSGTPAEAWTSEGKLRTLLPEFNPQLDALDNAAGDTGPAARQAIEADTGYPSVLFNGMIRPLAPFGIKGVVWYQGETNAKSPRDDRKMHDVDGPTEYRTLLPALITDWRNHWGLGNFPFLVVQLAGYGDTSSRPAQAWAQLRAAQFYAYLNTLKVSIVTAVDIGEPGKMQPKNKQEVGRRLAVVAEHDVYNIDVLGYGPVFKSVAVDGSKLRVEFEQVGRGVKLGPKVLGFAIAGRDGKFVPADAKVEGNTVVVTSPKVQHPTQIEYAWGGFMPNTLQNSADLPAFPFQASVPVK